MVRKKGEISNVWEFITVMGHLLELSIRPALHCVSGRADGTALRQG